MAGSRTAVIKTMGEVESVTQREMSDNRLAAFNVLLERPAVSKKQKFNCNNEFAQNKSYFQIS